MALLEVRDLRTYFAQRKRTVRAVDGVSFDVNRGEVLGIVGESGCGKSMTALSVMGLIPTRGEIVSGSVKIDGRELVGADETLLRQVRGNEISMIFQDPITSLNPTMKIGQQIGEALKLHRSWGDKQVRERVIEVLNLVGFPSPRERIDEYPHQFSGGMRQRAMIAMALACEPKVLIADEPTTALDVTIQAQILGLLDQLRSTLGMSIILITHDLGVVAGRADRVVVMYAGQIVEEASADDLFYNRRHPYTEALLSAIPRLEGHGRSRLLNIPGLPPDLSQPPLGCRFHPRCPRAQERCAQEEPRLTSADTFDHQFACFYPMASGEALRGSAS